MSQNISAETSKLEIKKQPDYIILVIIFLLIAAAGLYYVKWSPYYTKAFTAASKHSIGASIVTGKAATAPAPSWNTAWAYSVAYFKSVWKAVVLALLLGSLMQVLIPRNWIKKVLGQKNMKSTAVASATALPGMMCSCCAGPVAVGLRESSASINASLAFFLANPVLNPATIIFMGFVLSWKYAFFRIVMGIILVFGISTLANRFVKDDEVISSAIKTDEVEEAGNLFSRWMKSLWKLIVDTIPAYVIVVTLLGAFRAWLFPVMGGALSNSILAIILLAITGTLFAIPTAAEIPIIQTLMSFGLGAGPAAALLMTLPSVSLPSLLIIRRAFPRRVLVFVALGVAVIGIVSGLIAMVIL